MSKLFKKNPGALGNCQTNKAHTNKASPIESRGHHTVIKDQHAQALLPGELSKINKI